MVLSAFRLQGIGFNPPLTASVPNAVFWLSEIGQLPHLLFFTLLPHNTRKEEQKGCYPPPHTKGNHPCHPALDFAATLSPVPQTDTPCPIANKENSHYSYSNIYRKFSLAFDF